MKKLPKGVNFAESCKIAAWYQALECKNHTAKGMPAGIEAEQVTSWLKYYGFVEDPGSTTGFKRKEDKQEPRRDALEE